jgi:uncharacterized membrane protein
VIAWLGSSRGLIVLLLVSLGANLFLGGVLMGGIAGEATQGSQTRRSIHAMLAPLPTGKRELVRREFNAAMPQVRREFAALQQARAVLMEELVRPQPDNAAIERGFADVQKYTGAIRTELQQAMMRALPALTEQERRALVQALARQHSGGALPFP